MNIIIIIKNDMIDYYYYYCYYYYIIIIFIVIVIIIIIISSLLSLLLSLLFFELIQVVCITFLLNQSRVVRLAITTDVQAKLLIRVKLVSTYRILSGGSYDSGTHVL